MQTSNKPEEGASGRQKTPGDLVTLILLGIGVVAIIFFSQTNIAAAAMVFGLFFVLFGVRALLRCGAQVGQLIGNLMLTLIGICIAVPAGLLAFGSVSVRGLIYGLLPFLLLGAFGAAGLFLVVVPPCVSLYMKRTCTIEVMGECVELKTQLQEDDTRRAHPVYAGVFRYWYNGTEYVETEGSYANVDVPVVGQQLPLFLNPAHPEVPYRPSTQRLRLKLILGGGFLLLVAITVAMMVSNSF